MNYKDREKISEKLKKYSSYLYSELELERKPVGVKILYSKEEYDENDFKESEYRMSYCVYLEKATRGLALKHKLANHYCDGATTAFNLEYPGDEIESGEVYYSYGLYKTRAIAKRVRDGVKGLYRQNIKVYGLATGPLESFNDDPDVVVVICKPNQAMRIEQGYIYQTGDRLNYSSAAMQGVCSASTVEPYLRGKINISSLCPSTRFLAKWKDYELSVGIPYEQLSLVIEGIKDIKINTAE